MGKRISISPGFCALICLLGWIDGSVCLCFVIAVVVHEMAHLLAALCCRVSVERVHFRVCGAVIQTCGMDYRREIWVSFAGPAASLLSACIMSRWVGEYFVISGLLGLINLLPVYPMDGGRMLRGLLHLLVKPSAAERVQKIMAFVVCGVLMLAACWYTAVCQAGIWPIFAALTVLLRVGEAAMRECT